MKSTSASLIISAASGAPIDIKAKWRLKYKGTILLMVSLDELGHIGPPDPRTSLHVASVYGDV
jgi:hypothetical protein